MEHSQNTVRVEMGLRLLSSDVHSMSAGIIPSAAWRLVWALGTMKDQQEQVLVEGLCQENGPKALDVVELDVGYSGEGGKTIVPASARCQLDVTPAAGLDAEAVAAKIRAHLAARGFGDIQVSLC